MDDPDVPLLGSPGLVFLFSLRVLFRAKPEKLTFKLLAFLLLPSIKGTEFNSSFADQVMEKVKRCGAQSSS